MKAFVPSIGSMIQRRPVVPGGRCLLLAEDRRRPGTASASCSRRNRSASLSAAVTGVPSPLRSTARSAERNQRSVRSPAVAQQGHRGVEGGLVDRRGGHRGSLAQRRCATAVPSRRPGTSRAEGRPTTMRPIRCPRRDRPARRRVLGRRAGGRRRGLATPRRPVRSRARPPSSRAPSTGPSSAWAGSRSRCRRSAVARTSSGGTGPTVAGEESVNGTTWGDYTVVGTYATARSPSRSRPSCPSRRTASRRRSRPRTPCPEPAGGWVVIDPATTTQATQDAVMAAARSAPDYSGAWVDQSINPSYADGEIAVGDERR